MSVKLKCLASGSSGNCYIIETEDEALIIEAGVKFKDVKLALEFNVSKIVGVIVSHRHNDHSVYLKEYDKSAIYTYCSEDVAEAKGIASSHFNRTLFHKKGVKIGRFRITPLDVMHDVPCFAFIIDHEEMGRLLFATDMIYLGSDGVRYSIPKLNHIMIEANYSDTALKEAIEEGETPFEMRNRLLHSHCELGTTEKILKNQNLSAVENIVLIHLSSNNADKTYFKSRITNLTGKVVYIATSGLRIDLTKEKPY